MKASGKQLNLAVRSTSVNGGMQAIRLSADDAHESKGAKLSRLIELSSNPRGKRHGREVRLRR